MCDFELSEIEMGTMRYGEKEIWRQGDIGRGVRLIMGLVR